MVVCLFEMLVVAVCCKRFLGGNPLLWIVVGFFWIVMGGISTLWDFGGSCLL